MTRTNQKSIHYRAGSAIRWILILLVLGAAAAAWTTGVLSPSWIAGSSKSKKDPSILSDLAVRGPFLVSIPVQGAIDSRKNSTLISSVEGTTAIIQIVPEGTLVNEGDVVCVLDSAALREKAQQQQITVTQAESALATAKGNLEIQINQNESDISAGELALKLADLDLIKYEMGEFPQQDKQLSGNVALADEDLLRARTTYKFTDEQVKKGYKTSNDLEAARIAVRQAELKLQGAEEELKVLKDFTYQRTVAELKAKARDAQLELERIKLKAQAAKDQAEKDVEAKQLTYTIEQEKLARLETQIQACTLKAPQPGEVVYANMSSSRGRSDSVTIEEGAMVRERQAIINLPDISQMKVACRIHESLIGNVRKGLKARIRVDAYPDEVFKGEVAQVSSVPMSGSWPNMDLREYASEVFLVDEVDKIRKLRPGLTAQVEILVDNRDDVLQVPIQAVVTVADKQVVYVLKEDTSERREIKMGQSNQSHAEIVDGVAEGERVILNPKTRFANEIAELEAKLNAERAKETAKDPGTPSPATAVPGTPGAGPPPAGTPGAPGPGGPGGGNGPPGGGGAGPGAGGGRGFSPSAMFERFDTNKDGKISLEEAPDRMKENFSTVDKDGDGSISQEELSASRPPGGGGAGGNGPPGGGGTGGGGGGRPPGN